MTNPPQETGIDEILVALMWIMKPSGTEELVKAKQDLLQLFEKEAEIVEFPYEVHGEYERKAISLSKLRELLGGAKNE